MKKKILIILIIVFGLGLASLGVILTINNDNKSNTTNDNSPTEPIDKEPDLTDQEQGAIISKLTEYGIQIYDDGSYLSLNQTDEYYYITLGELKNRGYSEIDNLVYSCGENDPIIYFYKNIEGFEFYPIVVSYYCGTYSPKD